MPRNSQGTYALPNPPLQDGTTIVVGPHNGNYTDLGAEITNSLARDGKGGMTGQLKAAIGSQDAPGIAYGQDTDTGFRRSGPDINTAVSGGQDVFDVTADGIVMREGKTIQGAGSPEGDGFPSGTVMLFGQTTAPTGWTKNTDHNDKALRIVSGTVGSGGSSSFSTVFTARTIARNNLPDFTLSASGTTGSAGGHSHNVSRGLGSVPSSSGTDALSTTTSSGSFSTSSVGNHNHNVSLTTGSVNGGVPQQAMNFAVAYVDVIMATKD